MAKAATTHHTAGAFPQPESLPLDGFTRWSTLKSIVPNSREWVRLREKEGRFPKRVHLSLRCTAWPNRELHKWLADPLNYRAAPAANSTEVA
ncbi:transcriptional regulator [Caballeronia catudaia]|uniref:Transcriptional regulator n=1 Tax=Caballeronia catudaia TaxID=1777136 RepID=A0A158DQE2_9BURK|nr:AlpA family phage regulatory protein [Caballeronia catudaia]SAK96824.1 transcriptional regulator [Caballeronia catudaia]